VKEVAESAGKERSRSGRPPATTHVELERIAFGLFERNGFEQTSVDDIAAAAGIARRTFFRYYPSKTDLVWGDFDHQLEHLRRYLADTPADVALMEAVRQAVIDFNRLPEGEDAAHRRRMSLILEVPILLANSTLRFAQWRAAIAEFAGHRLELPPDELLPTVIGYSALGASLAAYELWLRDDQSKLAHLLDEAFAELATGFSHHGRPDEGVYG
jgi:mycofactocin system transcriptional regulator